MIWGCEHDYNIRRNRRIKTGYAPENPSLSGMRASSGAGRKCIGMQNTGAADRKMMRAAHEVAQACEENHRKDRLSTSVFQRNFGLRLMRVRPALAEETGSPDVPDHGSEMGAKPVDEILATAARAVVFPGERN